MRFTKNGPDIPDELLFAQDEGNVVFFCGAGVSMGHAKLASFSDLAERVIDDLGATEESKAKKLYVKFAELNKDSHTRGVISADHIFSGLIRSFDRNDINCSVARSLLPKGSPDLTAHKTMLKLAQTPGGKTRLITTNFDLLFEAAGKSIKSVTRSNLPNIEYTDNDWGIVHLHGKVKKDYSGPDRDGFVLSSSEFGDAYLAQGWARNFVKDVLGKFVAVFIGYSADDPPVRYLLEGLQQNDGSSHDIYAFQSADDEAIAQWAEKGVTPIIYDLDKSSTHAPLWDTLNSWGVRTKNPATWKNKLLLKAKNGPVRLEAHERGMVAHLIKSQSGAKAFQQVNPPMSSEWLCVFDPAIRLRQVQKLDQFYPNEEVINPRQVYGIDSDPPPSDRNEKYSGEAKAWDAFLLNERDSENLNERQMPNIRNFGSSTPSTLPARLHYLSIWIAKIAVQRITVWWAGQQHSLHPGLLKLVRVDLQKEKDIPKPIVKAWNAIFELSYFYERGKYKDYDFKKSIRSSGWSNFHVREYIKISAPFLKIGNLYSFSIPRDKRKKLTEHSLVRIDVDYPKGIYDISIPDEYLSKVINALRINLEQAIDMKQDLLIWIDDICAIEQGGTNDNEHSRGYGLNGYVLNFVRLFRKLTDIELKKARLEFKSWNHNSKVFTRLRIWACGLNGLVGEEEFTREILSLSDDDFWPFKGERDLLLSLKSKWNDLSNDNRNLIERRILKGPAKYRRSSKEKHVIHSAHNQLCRLHWLSKQGCNLCLNLEAVTDRLRVKAPEWKEEYADNAAESRDPVAGTVLTDTDWSNLNNIPLAEVIEKAKSIKSRNFREFTESAPFIGLCDEKPLRAISALSLELKEDRFHTEFWESYLSRDTRKKDSYRLKLLTAGRITQILEKHFKDILLTASRWFEDQGPELREKNPKIFNALWGKFISTITEHHDYSRSSLVREGDLEIDWTGEAINSASGNLAELHMTDPAKDNLALGEGFPKKWLEKVKQLLNLPNDAHRYSMVIFSFNLRWLHVIDPEWTEKNLIKIVEGNKANKEDSDAIWAGFMWGANFPNEELYLKLKPHLLRMASEKASEKRRHVEVLSGLLLSGWGSKDKNMKQYVSDEELRNILLVAGDDFRSHTLWHIRNWARDSKSNWNGKILRFLQKAWPKHKTVRTNKTSASLCEIAFEQKNNFPAVSRQVAQLVSKVEDEHLFIQEVRKAVSNDGESNLAEDYPEDYLNLLYTILPDQSERWPYGTVDALKIIEETDSSLLNDPRFIELKARLSDS